MLIIIKNYLYFFNLIMIISSIFYAYNLGFYNFMIQIISDLINKIGIIFVLFKLSNFYEKIILKSQNFNDN